MDGELFDEAVDVMAVIEACEQEVNHSRGVWSDSGSAVRPRTAVRLRVSVGAGVLRYEEDVEAQPDAMETCTQLFENKTVIFKSADPKVGSILRLKYHLNPDRL